MKLLGGPLGQIPAGAIRVRTAIDHLGPHVATPVLERHLGPARELAVGDADRRAAQALAAGGPVAVEARPVPGGDAARHRPDDLLTGALADDAGLLQAL